MKKNGLLLFLISCLCLQAISQTITLTRPPNGGNQKSSVSQWMGLGFVTITFRGPDVHDNSGKDRRGHIWGELVHYGFKDLGFGTAKASPWRAGSNEITTIQFSHPMRVNGRDIPAGTYGLMLALDSAKAWTWILSSNATSWGTYYYDPKDDVLRVDAYPENTSYAEWLNYSFDDRQAASCMAWLHWEDKRIGFKIELPKANDLYVDKMKEELVGYAGFDRENWARAAKFCLDSMVRLNDGFIFINNAMDTARLNGKVDPNKLRIKYELAFELHRSIDAEKTLEQLINLREVTDADLLLLGKNIFRSGKLNAAIAYWESVIRLTPADKKSSIQIFEAEIKKLKLAK